MERKTDPEALLFWLRRLGRIETNKGGVVVDNGRMKIDNHGLSMMDDLIGKRSFFQILALNAADRHISAELANWLEAAFLCVSYPDARIWCNQIGSLAGTLHASPVAAATAGILASDSRLYGPGTQRAGVAFINDALAQKQLGSSLEKIIAAFPRRAPDGAPLIPGYARPLVGGRDERIAPLERVRLANGLAMGEHLRLAMELSEALERDHGRSINALGYCVAMLCDHGFDAETQYRLMSVMVLSGVIACHAEAADQPGEAFMPLRCQDVRYQGKPPRPLP